MYAFIVCMCMCVYSCVFIYPFSGFYSLKCVCIFSLIFWIDRLGNFLSFLYVCVVYMFAYVLKYMYLYQFVFGFVFAYLHFLSYYFWLKIIKFKARIDCKAHSLEMVFASSRPEKGIGYILIIYLFIAFSFGGGRTSDKKTPGHKVWAMQFQPRDWRSWDVCVCSVCECVQMFAILKRFIFISSACVWIEMCAHASRAKYLGTCVFFFNFSIFNFFWIEFWKDLGENLQRCSYHPPVYTSTHTYRKERTILSFNMLHLFLSARARIYLRHSLRIIFICSFCFHFKSTFILNCNAAKHLRDSWHWKKAKLYAMVEVVVNGGGVGMVVVWRGRIEREIGMDCCIYIYLFSSVCSGDDSNSFYICPKQYNKTAIYPTKYGIIFKIIANDFVLLLHLFVS